MSLNYIDEEHSMSTFSYYEEPDPIKETNDDAQLALEEDFSASNLSTAVDAASTPINTISYFDEPDPTPRGQESSASPPPPNTIQDQPSSAAKLTLFSLFCFYKST